MKTFGNKRREDLRAGQNGQQRRHQIPLHLLRFRDRDTRHDFCEADHPILTFHITSLYESWSLINFSMDTSYRLIWLEYKNKKTTEEVSSSAEREP